MRDEFIRLFGGIYEHSPWVAERAFAVLGEGFASLAAVQRVMADCVDNAAREQQLTLIRAHPDLAGKAQIAGELTQESSTEQNRAGLDQCSSEEYSRFSELNADYKKKFDFPFIMAVRNSDRQQILAAFATRVANTADVEFETALSEIHKIAALRFAALEHAE